MKKLLLILLLSGLSCKKEGQQCHYVKLMDVNITIPANHEKEIIFVMVYLYVDEKKVDAGAVNIKPNISYYPMQFDISNWWDKKLYINQKVFHTDRTFYYTEKKLIIL